MADVLKLRRNVCSCVESETWMPETFHAWFRVSVNRPSAGQRSQPTPKHPATRKKKKPSSLQLKLLRDSSLSADANLHDQVTSTTNFHTFRSSYLNEV